MRLVSIFILFILMGIGVQAQVSFVVKASKKTLGINERLRIDFEMNEDGDNFVPPSFKGFNVVGGPNQSISNSWINGKRSYSKTYSYFLAPKSQGTFTVNQATIEIDDQIYKTTPLKIIITEAVSKPKDGNSADYVASENVHLIAEVSKSNPFLNDKVILFGQVLAGAAGGGDVSTGEGLIFKPSAGFNYKINNLHFSESDFCRLIGMQIVLSGYFLLVNHSLIVVSNLFSVSNI